MGLCKSDRLEWMVLKPQIRIHSRDLPTIKTSVENGYSEKRADYPNANHPQFRFRRCVVADSRDDGTFESAVVPSLIRIKEDSFELELPPPLPTLADLASEATSNFVPLRVAPGTSCTSKGVSRTPEGSTTVSALCTLGSTLLLIGGGSGSGGVTSESRIESTVVCCCVWLEDELACRCGGCCWELRLLGSACELAISVSCTVSLLPLHVRSERHPPPGPRLPPMVPARPRDGSKQGSTCLNSFRKLSFSQAYRNGL
uniref:Uncharacterized protein n=1 Tax=Anopheles atroparvus TaxID=41427 RepID=A0A182JJI3_ANOAO